MADRAFGRKFVIDERDKQFRMSAFLKKGKSPKLPPAVVLNTGPILDQGKQPICVGTAMREVLTWLQGNEKGATAQQLYDGAKAHDELGPDEPYTTVRAGLKELQRLKHITNYYWAESVDDVKAWLLGGYGPIVVGSDWMKGMLDTDRYGYIFPTGKVIDGHAFVLNGWDEYYISARIQQSWGPEWGRNGLAYMTRSDLEILLAPDKGEAAGVVR